MSCILRECAVSNSRAEQPQSGYHRSRPQAGSLPSGHRSWRTCLRNSPGSQQSRSITAAAIFRAFRAHSARSHNFSAERRSIRSQGSNSLVSRRAANLNSNICDGSGLRQQMDVWFCVPPQEPKAKALGKELQNIHPPAPSERGTKILAFP